MRQCMYPSQLHMRYISRFMHWYLSYFSRYKLVAKMRYCMYFSCFLNDENCYLLCTSIKHLWYQSTATVRYCICCYQFFMTVIVILFILQIWHFVSHKLIILTSFICILWYNCKQLQHFCYIMQSNGWYPIKLTTMYNDCNITVISLTWRAPNHKKQMFLVSFLHPSIKSRMKM